MHKRFLVDADDAGMRLDCFLAAKFPDVTRSQVKHWIDGGEVRVEGETCKAGRRLAAGETIVVEVESGPRRLASIARPLEIVYEDDWLFVVNKPSGLVVHPTPTYEGTTLVEVALDRLSAFDDTERPGVVHRLDKETSGLLILAKDPATRDFLQEALRERRIERRYLALVAGVIDHLKGEIDAPIGRHPTQRHRMAVVEGGRKALTRFRVHTRYERHTLVACSLATGRTHQIRVHFAYIGHPVIGDPLYGPKKARPIEGGQLLHAAEVAFPHPEGGSIRLSAPLPSTFRDFLEGLK